MPHVIVASTNPVKLQSAKLGFEQMFPDQQFTFEGLDSPSGVSNQPMTSEETRMGARNRAEYARKSRPDADYYIGIEGGLMTDDQDCLVSIAWIAILDKDGRSNSTATGTFLLPTIIAEGVRSGLELGAAADKLHGTVNIKHGMGTVGLLTGGIIDRTTYYVPAVVLALIPFKNPELY